MKPASTQLTLTYHARAFGRTLLAWWYSRTVPLYEWWDRVAGWFKARSLVAPDPSEVCTAERLTEPLLRQVPPSFAYPTMREINGESVLCIHTWGPTLESAVDAYLTRIEPSFPPLRTHGGKLQ